MSEPTSARLDLIKELRLRRWARTHWVPPEERQASWHPVVLEEMQRRDAELSDHVVRPSTPHFGYVPLVPDSPERLDLPHLAVGSPKTAALPVRADVKNGVWN